MLDDTDRVSLVLQVDIAAECQDRVQVPEGTVGRFSAARRISAVTSVPLRATAPNG